MQERHNKSICRLTELVQGKGGTVVKFKLAEKETSRLNDLGLHHGSNVKVLQGDEEHGILLAVGDARIAVNFDVAASIYVAAQAEADKCAGRGRGFCARFGFGRR